MAKYLLGASRCADYAADSVARALARAVDGAGGFPPCAGGRILIKANLLSPSPPEKAVTTHPEILRAIIGAARNNTGAERFLIADNPGHIFNDMKKLHETTQIAPLSEIEGVDLGVLSGQGVALAPCGAFRSLPDARVAKQYMEAAYCINAAKLKTHVETEISGCVKNIFGIADTATRKKAHMSRSAVHLANAICDLFTIRPPEFNVLDAVIGMEGDGPSFGNPRQLGWIFASRNALAADFAGAVVMGYKDPAVIPLIKAASERGLGPASIDEIELVGAEWDDLPAGNFRKSSGTLRLVPTFLRGVVHGLLSLKPVLEKEACVRCFICREVCPVDAIERDGEYPRVKRGACVRCLCCHEMCPTGAMKVGKNALAAIVSRARGE